MFRLGGTTCDIDDAIPCFLLDEFHTEGSSDDDEEDLSVPCDPVFAMQSISDKPEEVPIKGGELLREQGKDEFCSTIRARLRKGEKAPFADNEMGFLCRYAVDREQLVMPLSLQSRGLCLSHYSKLASHPGGRRLFYYLIRYFYWPSCRWMLLNRRLLRYVR